MSWLLCLFDSVGLDYDASYKACAVGVMQCTHGALKRREAQFKLKLRVYAMHARGWGSAKLNCSGVILKPSYKPGIRRFELTT